MFVRFGEALFSFWGISLFEGNNALDTRDGESEGEDEELDLKLDRLRVAEEDVAAPAPAREEDMAALAPKREVVVATPTTGAAREVVVATPTTAAAREVVAATPATAAARQAQLPRTLTEAQLREIYNTLVRTPLWRGSPYHEMTAPRQPSRGVLIVHVQPTFDEQGVTRTWFAGAPREDCPAGLWFKRLPRGDVIIKVAFQTTAAALRFVLRFPSAQAVLPVGWNCKVYFELNAGEWTYTLNRCRRLRAENVRNMNLAECLACDLTDKKVAKSPGWEDWVRGTVMGRRLLGAGPVRQREGSGNPRSQTGMAAARQGTAAAREVVVATPTTASEREVVVATPTTGAAREVVVATPTTGAAREVVVATPTTAATGQGIAGREGIGSGVAVQAAIHAVLDWAEQQDRRSGTD
ncbi:hypothetical protein BC832DRAFT_624068 [Gaertneriomyces semiglobifer]|nr:hypothetical protein BC832DRAFT_624068 [Gaertneriomyces semiglobifer]